MGRSKQKSDDQKAKTTKAVVTPRSTRQNPGTTQDLEQLELPPSRRKRS